MQEHEISRLVSEVSRLQDVRTQHEMSIQHLQNTVSKTTEEHECRRDQATHTVHALSSELKTTKQALEDVTKRERQVDYLISSHLLFFNNSCQTQLCTKFIQVYSTHIDCRCSV